MSGVIDSNGVQWEHCSICGKMHRIENLGYLPPSTKHPHGLDIGLCCINTLTQSQIRLVEPGSNWVAKYSK